MVIVRSVDDFHNKESESCIYYLIKERVDLGGAHISLAPNSKLLFKKGSLVNGIVEGNNTQIKRWNNQNVFCNCLIRGTWRVEYAYSTMFDDDLDAIVLLRNLSRLSPKVRLSSNREYHITAKGEVIELELLEAVEKRKPTLRFHTEDPNINGLNISGDNVILRNLIIVDDYNPLNDLIYGKNNLTSGNTIGVCSSKKEVETLHISGCEFKGSTSSSYIASSQTKNCLIKNCFFSGYMADHAIYCSMKAVSFALQDCIINDVEHTTGLFKIRTSNEFKSFYLKNIKANNLNGYMARISLLETPSSLIHFDGITVSKDVNNKSIFYGFCITDETEQLEGTGRYNTSEIIVNNCVFEYGYGGESMIYPGSEKKVCAKTIKYINVKATQSNFGGGVSDYLYVNHCHFKDCTDNQGILIASKNVLIENSTLSRDNSIGGNNLFLLNYSKVNTDSFQLNSVDFDLNVGNMFKINNGDNIELRLKKCYLPSLSKNLIYSSPKNHIVYKIENNKGKTVGTYNEIGNCSVKPVIAI